MCQKYSPWDASDSMEYKYRVSVSRDSNGHHKYSGAGHPMPPSYLNRGAGVVFAPVFPVPVQPDQSCGSPCLPPDSKRAQRNGYSDPPSRFIPRGGGSVHAQRTFVEPSSFLPRYSPHSHSRNPHEGVHQKDGFVDINSERQNLYGVRAPPFHEHPILNGSVAIHYPTTPPYHGTQHHNPHHPQRHCLQSHDYLNDSSSYMKTQGYNSPLGTGPSPCDSSMQPPSRQTAVLLDCDQCLGEVHRPVSKKTSFRMDDILGNTREETRGGGDLPLPPVEKCLTCTPPALILSIDNSPRHQDGELSFTESSSKSETQLLEDQSRLTSPAHTEERTPLEYLFTEVNKALQINNFPGWLNGYPEENNMESGLFDDSSPYPPAFGNMDDIQSSDNLSQASPGESRSVCSDSTSTSDVSSDMETQLSSLAWLEVRRRWLSYLRMAWSSGLYSPDSPIREATVSIPPVGSVDPRRVLIRALCKRVFQQDLQLHVKLRNQAVAQLSESDMLVPSLREQYSRKGFFTSDLVELDLQIHVMKKRYQVAKRHFSHVKRKFFNSKKRQREAEAGTQTSGKRVSQSESSTSLSSLVEDPVRDLSRFPPLLTTTASTPLTASATTTVVGSPGRFSSGRSLDEDLKLETAIEPVQSWMSPGPDSPSIKDSLDSTHFQWTGKGESNGKRGKCRRMLFDGIICQGEIFSVGDEVLFRTSKVSQTGDRVAASSGDSESSPKRSGTIVSMYQDWQTISCIAVCPMDRSPPPVSKKDAARCLTLTTPRDTVIISPLDLLGKLEPASSSSHPPVDGSPSDKQETTRR